MNSHNREDLLRLVSTIEALELRDAAQVRTRQLLLEKLRRYLREGSPSERSATTLPSPAEPAPAADRIVWPVIPPR